MLYGSSSVFSWNASYSSAPLEHAYAPIPGIAFSVTVESPIKHNLPPFLRKTILFAIG
jgi:hypothetical protein